MDAPIPYPELMQVLPRLERALGVWMTPTLGFQIEPHKVGHQFPVLERVFDACRPVIEQWAEEVKPFIFSPKLESVPETEVDETTPYWNNAYFPAGDARLAYAVVARYRPRTIVEVGCGHSTRFMRRAIQDHGLTTKIVCIDPTPRASVTKIADEVHAVSCTAVSADFFVRRLSAGDVLFIDGSHLVMNGSDVVHLFLDVIPLLPEGVIVHVHDVFLPWDYPYDLHINCRYNEQYLLAALFLYGREWTPVLPIYDAYLRGILPHGGGSFWMVKQPRPQ